MKHSVRGLGLLAVASLMLAACQTTAPRPTAAGLPTEDAACVVTEASYKHIYERHCTAESGASQFLPQYCTQDGMQTFCQMVQNSPRQWRAVQPNGRIRYDSNLGQVVGAKGEKCGRLVITSETDGEVVTQFPELNNAPPACK